MKKCPKCAEEVQDDAKVCRYCGFKFPSVSRDLLKLAKALPVVVVVFLLARTCSSDLAEPSNNQQINAYRQPYTPLPTPTPSWFYSEDTDSLRNTKTTLANNRSTNTIDLPFPYNGGTMATLIIRKRAQDGLSVILSVNKGQFICHSPGCKVSIGFDGAPPKKYNASEPSDYSSDTLFLAPSGDLVSKLRASKKAIVEVEFYRDGFSQFKFDTADLHWPPKEADLKP